MIGLVAMDPRILVSTLVCFALARLIVVLHGNSAYSCPVCGAKTADKHAGECPWSRRR